MASNPRVLSLKSREELSEEMKSIGVGKAGVDIMWEKGIFHAVRLDDVPIRAAILIKQEMLAKGGEAALPIKAASLSVESCSAILLGTARQFRECIMTLRRQPFGLPAIADELERTLESYLHSRTELKLRDRTIPLGGRTIVMGILNVTPDSFSDGGQYLEPNIAVDRALRMLDEGADIIDIGGESSRPGATPVPLDVELDRVIPIVSAIASKTRATISVDTYKSQVAREALDAGAHMVNDITALRGEGDMAEVVAGYQAAVVLMHMRGMPRDMQKNTEYQCVTGEVMGFLRERIRYAEDRGIAPECIVVDPGIGFGKGPEHNLEIMRRLSEFRGLGRPILMGTSRKSTIGRVLDLPVGERGWGTAATVALSIANGADIIRVHDVLDMVRVARMTDAVVRGWREEGDNRG